MSVSPLPFSAIDLKIWFKGMRTRYGKLTCKKSGDGAKEHTDRDTWNSDYLWIQVCSCNTNVWQKSVKFSVVTQEFILVTSQYLPKLFVEHVYYMLTMCLCSTVLSVETSFHHNCLCLCRSHLSLCYLLICYHHCLCHHLIGLCCFCNCHHAFTPIH